MDRFTVGRRQVVAGLAGTLGVATIGLAGCSAARPAAAVPSVRRVHQPGVLTPPPQAAALVAFDVTSGRDGFANLVAAVSARQAAAHTATGTAACTVTVGLGASLFDDRFGLGEARPRLLREMPEFPNDVLDPRWCHGDLLLQICAEDGDRVAVVERDLVAAAGPALRQRWRMDCFRPENGVTAGGQPSTRNLFGFREGAGNPDPRDGALMDRLVWAGDGEPDWAAGGTYQVVRLIRLATALWATDPVPHQEAVFGRRRDDGAPLGGAREDEAFDYGGDPDGQRIRLDAHIRRANPRTPGSAENRILRRSYSFEDAGHAGLAFVCFQRDPERGFAATQNRLTGEALQRYVLPFGGGYFFVPSTLEALPVR